MKSDRLTVDELRQQCTVLQPPPTQYTLFAWGEALRMTPEDAADNLDSARWFFTEVQRFIEGPKRDHQGINRALLHAWKNPTPITEEMISQCRGWMAEHARRVEEEVLPAQGFTRLYSSVWQRGGEFLLTVLDGWAYSLFSMSPEEWKEFRIDDQCSLLLELVHILNTLAGPDLPEDLRLNRAEIDAEYPGPETGYPPFPESLKHFREVFRAELALWKSPQVEAFLEEIEGLTWEGFAAHLAATKLRLSL